jgi:AcrR family transcriptional regulator
MRNTKEDAILTTATRLFSEWGYHVIGVDRIIAESNVAKMTFYKYFVSKEELIEKVLENRDQLIREKILESISSESTPRKRLHAIFTWYENWLKHDDFNSCMFIKASEEFSFTENKKIRDISKSHKLWLLNTISELLHEIGVHSEELAYHILMLLDGLTVNANVLGRSKEIYAQVEPSWRYVETLIKQKKK